MGEKPQTAPDQINLVAFSTTGYYIIGVGETIDELQVTGEWIATDTPQAIRR